MAVGPYLQLSQLTFTNAYKREWAREKLTSTIESVTFFFLRICYEPDSKLHDSSFIDDFDLRMLNRIDYDTKSFIQCGVDLKYCHDSLVSAKKLFFNVKINPKS